MAHEEVYGFCENKCKVPVAPKTETDAVEERVTALEAGEFESANIGTLKFGSIIMPTLSYSGTYTRSYGPQGSGSINVPFAWTVPIFFSSFPISGKILFGSTYNATIVIISPDGETTHASSTTETEYTVTNALMIYAHLAIPKGSSATVTIGIPKLV